MATLAHPHSDQVKFASGIDVVAAIWLFISAFAVPMVPGLAWNDGIAAIVVGILAAVRAAGAYGESWLSWLNAMVGAWVLISPWVYSSTPYQSAVTSNVITGIAIIVFGIWSALATNTERPQRPTTGVNP